MNYKIILISILSLLLYGCNQNINNSKNVNFKIEKKYSNIGFALIFDDNLEKIKKIDDRSLLIYHKNLKKKSSVKITNPKNGKSLIAKVSDNSNRGGIMNS